MRILIASNGPNVPTGYGVPVKNLIPYFKAMGHTVAVQAFYGIQGGSVNYGDVMIYPGQVEQYGIDVIGEHAKHFNADVVLTLIDNWALPVDYNKRFDAVWLSWFPIDGYPAPEACVLQANLCDYPAVFSKFGVDELKKAGVDAYYMPYGIDCNAFKPGNKEEARDKLGLPANDFIITTVASNRGFPARKAWAEILMGFEMFADNHPDALLCLHTRKVPFSTHGIYFDPLIKDLGLEGRVVFTDAEALAVGYSNEDLADLYVASDIMLLPSMAEGFGVPIAEAQACGVPVITQNCCSMTELTINGIAIEPAQPFWAAGLNYWWQMPSVCCIHKALNTLYDMTPELRVARALEGVEHFEDNYDWPVVVMRYWRPLLEKVEAELW